MRPWEKLGQTTAPDGGLIELRRRGHEYLILADGYDLMSNEDESSARALGEFGCAGIPPRRAARVLVGGLGMGFTLRAALDGVGPSSEVEVAELIPGIVEWNRGVLGALAANPLEDPRTVVRVGDVGDMLVGVRRAYDAILLDVDNGPDALAHDANERLYDVAGLANAGRALKDDGVLGIWSFSDDAQFTRRLENAGFDVELRKVTGSRKGRGRRHCVWLARVARS